LSIDIKKRRPSQGAFLAMNGLAFLEICMIEITPAKMTDKQMVYFFQQSNRLFILQEYIHFNYFYTYAVKNK
jgi:hypothetical protein